ncbi:MAG: helix-turn-helix domain-containing protein [Simkaniaceae bacterium]
MQKIDDYLKIKDAAALVGVSPSTLRNWEREGKLRAHRNPHNGYRLYRREHLEALLEEIGKSAVDDSSKARRK